ncbi:hypothetical protein [Prochlorococcus sp. MIT 1307]|uniref:hypothetical protein n=1 Tax=Prochlorococcus sp. MIT 1307 TaxID=3096219 RepID=UPI002A75A411|nr:hypothetical protein [Prochlorococcus sp. MIT 1307]
MKSFLLAKGIEGLSESELQIFSDFKGLLRRNISRGIEEIIPAFIRALLEDILVLII